MPQAGRRVLLSRPRYRSRLIFSKKALLFQMDLAGVRHVILVPLSWEEERNDLALEAVRTYPTALP